MSMPDKSVNAWIFLEEDEPKGSSYKTHGSSYQSLIDYGVYNATDMVSICWVDTLPTSATTVPAGDGSTHTVQLQVYTHPDGSSNQQYMEWLIEDARLVNPDVKLLVCLGYGKDEITQVFSGESSQWPAQAAAFASNLVTYLQTYGLNGLDVDWEYPLSNYGTPEQFALLFKAVRAAFDAQDETYWLTFSPDQVGTLDAPTVNEAFDFVTLQLYDGFTCAEPFIDAGVNGSQLVYGAKFESTDGAPYQTAQQAAAGWTQQGCFYGVNTDVITQWRLNSNDFQYEQAQQMILYQLVHGTFEPEFDDTPIVGAAGNPLVSQLVIRSGQVLDAIQATNAGLFVDQKPPVVEYVLPLHGGTGGDESVVTIPEGDALVEVSGYTGQWFDWHCVLQITLTTRDGVVFGPFGTMENTWLQVPFAYTAPEGQSIVAFKGRVNNVFTAEGDAADIVTSLDVSFA